MAEPGNTANKDVVADSLAGPIDWARFEDMVYAVLVADDFPTLEKIGGVNDQGMDALEETFFDGKRKIQTIVQVTSASGQKAKVKDTIAKLKKNGIDTRNLVFVSRHPVSSENRRTIIADGENEGVTVTIRDSSYLIAELSKPGSPIFARFFAGTRDQFDALVNRRDPLKSTQSPAQRALLATLGAFVLSPRARLARNTLFDKTVLAVLASHPKGEGLDQIAKDVKRLSATDVDQAQLQSALARLINDGSCVAEKNLYRCSDDTLAKFLSVAKRADQGYAELLNFITAACDRVVKLSDSQRGYLERNVRRTLLQLLRTAGPLRSELESKHFEGDRLLRMIGKDLPTGMGKAAIVAMSSFATNPKTAPHLAPLMRSYCALAMRNIDPWGRSWQQQTLSRNVVALDTDALLYLLIEELPEHPPILKACTSLAEAGVSIVISDHVVDEAMSHIGRFHNTFLRFASLLLRMPIEAVNARVWHAVVRGYYHAHRKGFTGSAQDYLDKYWEPKRARAYVEHLISRRLAASIEPLNIARDDQMDVINEIEEIVMQHKERSRMKAGFRDPVMMTARVRADIAMALNLSEHASNKASAQAKGYLATSDTAFWTIERSRPWNKRAKVAVSTRQVPELSSFICGAYLTDDEAVELLFHQVTVTAAEQMSAEIDILTGIGVDLTNRTLDRLEWDLTNSLRDQIEQLEEALVNDAENGGSERVGATFNLAKAAAEAGYELSSPVQTLVNEFEESQGLVESERERRIEVEKQLQALIAGALQTTTKGRTRINALIKQLGIVVPESASNTDISEDDTPID